MKDNHQIQQKLKSLFQALPEIFIYQIITKGVLIIWVFFLKRIFQDLLRSSGRVAVTSGDYKFLFTTWQGILILLVGLISLFLYVAIDLNSKIVLSRNLITGESSSFADCIRICIKEGIQSVGRLFNLRGIIIVIYISFISPVLGIGLSISLTEKLYIPTFITAFIQSSVFYSALAGVAVLLFLFAGIVNLFVLHGIVIDKMAIKDARLQSRTLFKENWKDYLKKNILFIITITVILAGVAAVSLILPMKLISILKLPGWLSRLLTVLFVTAGVLLSVLADLLATPLYLMKMTQLFYSYKQDKEYQWEEKEKEKHSGSKAALLLIAVVAVASFFMYDHFDQLFPADTSVKIIAHRGGGNEGKENTLSGLEIARNAGAYGSEIDIQRTHDGHYILNHDGTFKRVAGEDRKPEEMTLQEVKELSIDGEQVPTFEEMLAASKGQMVLFTELKGKTADRKMADDVVGLVRQYQMEEECVIISLQYDLINYIETNYPEIQTGFLTFASFGETAALNCDYIGLEEESATRDSIKAVHKEGKKVLVWTVNKKGSQKYFLCTQVDGIITDNVYQAVKIVSELRDRSDFERMVDTIKTLF